MFIKETNEKLTSFDPVSQKLDELKPDEVTNLPLIETKKNLDEIQEIDNSNEDQLIVPELIEPEYIAEKPKMILDYTFQEASKINSTALYNIVHDEKQRPECKEFLQLVKDENYEQARETLLLLLPKMDKYINKNQSDKINFSSISENLTSITDSVELGQALLGLSQLFSRTPSVVGNGEGEYRFIRWKKIGIEDRSMGDLLKQRDKEIISNFNKSNLPDSLKSAYINLIGATENAIEGNPQWYQDKSKKTEKAHNKIGVNLGNERILENLLLDPEIYEGMQISFDNLDFEGKNEIINRTMENIINKKALLLTILKEHNIEIPGEELKVEIISNENGELKANVNGIEITLKVNMELGYYSQCANPIILTDNLIVNVSQPGNQTWKPIINQIIHEIWIPEMIQPGNQTGTPTIEEPGNQTGTQIIEQPGNGNGNGKLKPKPEQPGNGNGNGKLKPKPEQPGNGNGNPRMDGPTHEIGIPERFQPIDGIGNPRIDQPGNGNGNGNGNPRIDRPTHEIGIPERFQPIDGIGNPRIDQPVEETDTYPFLNTMPRIEKPADPNNPRKVIEEPGDSGREQKPVKPKKKKKPKDPEKEQPKHEIIKKEPGELDELKDDIINQAQPLDSIQDINANIHPERFMYK